MEAERQLRYFQTSNGVRLTIHGVSQVLLQKVVQSVKFPEPPYYENETATGDKERQTIDENFLKGEDLTPEERKLFTSQLEAYQKALHEAEADQNKRVNNAIFLKGIEIPKDMDNEEEWLEEQQFLGVEVPEDRFERRIHYIQTEILQTPADLASVMEMVMQLSGVPSKELAEAKRLFQHSLEGEVSAGEAGDSAEQLVVQ